MSTINIYAKQDPMEVAKARAILAAVDYDNAFRKLMSLESVTPEEYDAYKAKVDEKEKEALAHVKHYEEMWGEKMAPIFAKAFGIKEEGDA